MPLPRAASFLVPVILTGGACEDAPSGVEVPADLIGVVYEVQATPSGSIGPGSVRLTDLKPRPTGHPDSLVILVSHGTDIFVRRGARDPVPATFADIETGQTLRVWPGPVELRSLPPKWLGLRLEIVFEGVHLHTTASEYSPGDTIELVLDNRSEEPVGYNLCLAELQRRADGWEHADRQPGGGACTLELRILRAGERATERQPVFEWMEAGEYRFSASIEHPLGERDVTVTSPVFRIQSD